MKTFFNPDIARNQRQSWYPWPYTEVITIKEDAGAIRVKLGNLGS